MRVCSCSVIVLGALTAVATAEAPTSLALSGDEPIGVIIGGPPTVIELRTGSAGDILGMDIYLQTLPPFTITDLRIDDIDGFFDPETAPLWAWEATYYTSPDDVPYPNLAWGMVIWGGDAMPAASGDLLARISVSAPAGTPAGTMGWLTTDSPDFGPTDITDAPLPAQATVALIAVALPGPTVSSITPDEAANNGTVEITDLAGAGFLEGATVKLTRNGESDITASNISVISDTQITCSFDLSGAAAGAWNVVVYNLDSGPGTLIDGFTVQQAPATDGTLSVDTTPVKGEVLVDGVSWGTAPQSRTIAAGAHTVTFGDVSGYTKPDAETVTVLADQTINLSGTYTAVVPTTGTLSIVTTPVNGEVFVNGASWGIAPQNRSLAAGTYTVTFVLVEGYTSPASQTVSVQAGQITNVTAAYVAAPQTGTLSVQTSPVAGEVFVDGESWGAAPQSQTVSTGPHTVSFGDVPGYTKPSHQTATIQAGQTVTLTGVYALETGTLTVNTSPVAGEVLVNNASWGMAPQNRTVNVGAYVVSFGAVDGFSTPQAQTITVLANQTATVTGTYLAVPNTGTLNVDTDPVKGEVYVDGASFGTAPQSIIVAAGSHTVSFGNVTGYTKPANQTVSVLKGASVTVSGNYEDPNCTAPCGTGCAQAVAVSLVVLTLQMIRRRR